MTIGIGLAVIAVGFVLCSTWRTDSSYWHILGSLIVVVCGMALAMTPATNLILAAVPKNRSGMGSAMNDTVRELGGALGIAVLGAVISAGYSNGVTDATAQLPPELAEAAEGSLATAVMGVAPALEQAAGPAVAAQFLDTALASWMSGLTSAMLVAAVLAPRSPRSAPSSRCRARRRKRSCCTCTPSTRSSTPDRAAARRRAGPLPGDQGVALVVPGRPRRPAPARGRAGSRPPRGRAGRPDRWRPAGAGPVPPGSSPGG